MSWYQSGVMARMIGAGVSIVWPGHLLGLRANARTMTGTTDQTLPGSSLFGAAVIGFSSAIAGALCCGASDGPRGPRMLTENVNRKLRDLDVDARAKGGADESGCLGIAETPALDAAQTHLRTIRAWQRVRRSKLQRRVGEA